MIGIDFDYSNIVEIFNNSLYYNYDNIVDNESTIISFNNIYQEIGHVY
jgi:hypothetical protein